MVFELGQNPWILISLTFLEILFIIIPALIASKIENKPLKVEINEMGFHKIKTPLPPILLKFFAGLVLGIAFFLIGGYIIFFFKDIVVTLLFGAPFVQAGEEGAISTSPTNADQFQLLIILILQVVIVAPCEEGFFRGFIINKSEQKFKFSWVVILASTCFALYHVPPFIVSIATIISYFGYYFTFGILLALVFKYFDDSLIPCCIAHALFNILTILL